MFGPAAITQELSKKLLKWQSDVGGESTSCATFKIQAVEAGNLRVVMGMVKGDEELKIFHSMLKLNDLFVAQNISGNVIAFMGGSSTGMKTVDIQYSTGQAMGTAWSKILEKSN